MIRVSSAAAFVAVTAFLVADAPTAFASSVIDRAEQSVVRVINLDQKGTRLEFNAVGSGVVIDRAGFILTNEHVVVGADKVYVQWKTSAGEVRDDEAEVVAQDRAKDLALLRVLRIETPTVSMTTKVLAKGQVVFAIGFPAAADLPGGTYEDINQRFVEATVTQGIVSRLLTRDLPNNPNWPLVQHTAVTSGGSSGGALIDGCGNLVGISAAGAIEETSKGDTVNVQGFSYAIQAPAAFWFAKDNGANPEEIRSGCETGANSAKSETVGSAEDGSDVLTLLAFVIGAVAVFGAAVAVVIRGRDRRPALEQAPVERRSNQWELAGFTSSNDSLRITVIEHRHTESSPLVLGRDTSCDIVISDSTVSRHHAKLFVAQGELWCADLGSSNGTKVNGQSCGQSPMRVTRSGVVTLGTVTLQVRVSSAMGRQ